MRNFDRLNFTEHSPGKLFDAAFYEFRMNICRILFFIE